MWDYPRPPMVVSDEREIRVALDGVTVAETMSSHRVLETSHAPTVYVPKADIQVGFMRKRRGGSLCEWKGEATYWDVVVGDRKVDAKAWSYEEPFSEFEAIAGHVSFYPACFECYVNGERVRPQPGGFYGGWITSEVTGPFKGSAETTSW